MPTHKKKQQLQTGVSFAFLNPHWFPFTFRQVVKCLWDPILMKDDGYTEIFHTYRSNKNSPQTCLDKKVLLRVIRHSLAKPTRLANALILRMAKNVEWKSFCTFVGQKKSCLIVISCTPITPWIAQKLNSAIELCKIREKKIQIWLKTFMLTFGVFFFFQTFQCGKVSCKSVIKPSHA